ncbi:unnamed protein product [Tetraodon nigroviridis]|uniref:(spotted green pufferfish) hypothetical protein n=1 Tax=Tetraodon nigroviridis TaxID=99883 RepID=Q4RPE9_TETNG|nr:unnamed protein product [Tetraodon nigroviridis]
MTTEKKPKDAPANPSSREIGCQTDVAESSSSSCSLAQASEEAAGFGQSALGPSVGDQPEPSRSKRKTESPSWIWSSDGDSRSLQECLRLIRNNVVVLLRALLPQLDLTGISMDTSDVDSILQQIIEVNQMKV